MAARNGWAGLRRAGVRSRRRFALITLVFLATVVHVMPRLGFVASSPCGAITGRAECVGNIMLKAAEQSGSDTMDTVQVRCEDDGQWYDAVVQHHNSDGTLSVVFTAGEYTYSPTRVGIWRKPLGRKTFFGLKEGQDFAAAGNLVALESESWKQGAFLLVNDVGENVWRDGIVKSIENFGVFVRFPSPEGELFEGMVHISEIKSGRVDNIRQEFMVGQQVRVRILSVSFEDKRICLSMRPLREGLQTFENVTHDMWLDGTVDSIESYGAFVMVQPPSGGEAFKGLIHISEIRSGRVDDIQQEVMIGQQVRVRILSVSLEDQRMHLSMRPPSDGLHAFENSTAAAGNLIALENKRGHSESWKQGAFLLVNDVGENVWRDGIVKSIENFGVFVRFPSPEGELFEGMVHISEIKNGRVDNIRLEFMVGQQVRVRILSVSFEDKRICLSMRPLREGLQTFENVTHDMWLDGTVDSIESYGAFVMVQPPSGGEAFKGLIHISEIQSGRVDDIQQEVMIGQQVRVRILSVSLEDQQMCLSMRPPSDGLHAFENITQDAWLDGRVVSVESYGAFVMVQPPSGGESYRGMIHISEIKIGRVQRLEDEVTVGQAVKVRIVALDKERQRISLSLRPSPKQFIASLSNVSKDAWLDGVVEDVDPSGAFVLVKSPHDGTPFAGLVHISNIKNGLVESIEDEVSLGQEVKVRILTVYDNQKVALSMRPSREQLLAAFRNLSDGTWLDGVVREVMHEKGIAIVSVKSPSGHDESLTAILHHTNVKVPFVSNLSDELANGQHVKVRVTSKKSNKLRLSMLPRSNREPFQNISGDAWLYGVVGGLNSDGATVWVTCPSSGASCRGFSPLKELRHWPVVHAEDILSLGQSVKVRVKSATKKKLSLTMKEHQDLSGFQNLSVEEWLSGEVHRVEAEGVVVSVAPPSGGKLCLGFVHVSEVSEALRQSIEVGQNVSVRVCSAIGETLVLSMSDAQDFTGFDDVGQDVVLQAVVTQVSPEGAVAVLQPPGGGRACAGWLDKSRYREAAAEGVEEEMQVGQAIPVRVLSARQSGQSKLQLSMRDS